MIGNPPLFFFSDMNTRTLSLLVPALCAAPFIHAAELPGMTPGAATVVRADGRVTLRNAVLAASWTDNTGLPAPESFENLDGKSTLSQSGRVLFRIRTDKGEVTSASFKPVGALKVVDIPANPGALRAAGRPAGKSVVAELRDEATGLRVFWRAVLRDGSNYVRQEFAITGDKPVTLTGLTLQDVGAPGAKQVGSVPGSPVAVAGRTFFGVELPMTKNEVKPDGFSSGFVCELPVKPGTSHVFSTVFGVAPEGQLRRGFLYYLDRERARPASPFLHYNGWYDMAQNVREKTLLEAVNGFGEELVKKRGVKLDSFVVDDGWDDAKNTFWEFDKKKLPSGMKPVRDAAKRYGAGVGIWISPLGGYGEAAMRTANAAKLGLVKPGAKELDLAYEPYAKWYLDKSLDLMRRDGANYFKWDKAGDGVGPHFMALLRIAKDLHAADPALYMNVTVGTWPSPFWLNHIDCTWRGGADVFWEGKGDRREQWLTFRDNNCYGRVQSIAPLYPLNSIMHHGIVLGRAYQGATVAEAGNHLRHEARSFFANGTTMQELYLTPSMMDAAAWDDVAQAAKWARANADTLSDARIFGGKPATRTGKHKGPDGKDIPEYSVEPYGYASWSSKKCIVMVRNPDDVARDFVFDPAEALELPASERGVAKHFVASYDDQSVKSFEYTPGKKTTLRLAPFDVLVFETR